MDSVTVSRGWSPSLRMPTALGLLLALLTAAAWFAVPMKAGAYPECQAEFRVSPKSQKVRPGGRIVLTATCDFELEWRATFNGEVREGRGKNFREVFVAPNLRTTGSARTQVYRLDVVGRFVDSSLGDAECRRAFDITVTDGSQAAPPAGGQSALPNTGGPQLALLGLAILLLLAGVASVRRARQARPES